MTDKQLSALRWRDYSVVMQSAMNALNPVIDDRRAVQGRDRRARRLSGARIRGAVVEVLELVGIDPVHLRSYPHQLSGGMRQRAMIAMALLFTPDLVIMDEPTSALDVVAQRSLMVQIKELQRALGFAVIFVTHDMSLVSHFSDQLLVMYAGQVVETGPDPHRLRHPVAPVQPGAARRVPVDPRPAGGADRHPGRTARPRARPPAGCRFAPRCPQVKDRCRTTAPELYPVGAVEARACSIARITTAWQTDAARRTQ